MERGNDVALGARLDGDEDVDVDVGLISSTVDVCTILTVVQWINLFLTLVHMLLSLLNYRLTTQPPTILLEQFDRPSFDEIVPID